MTECYKNIVSSLINYRLVAAGYRSGAIIDFVPAEAVLYSALDMSKGKAFLILNRDAPQELKTLMGSLPSLWKSENKEPYHLAIGRLIGYTEPTNILANTSSKKSVGIVVKGVFKGQSLNIQIAPQLVSESNFQQAMDTLNRLKPHVESVKIPGFQVESVSVYDELSRSGGRRTRRNRKPI
jgi:hypothetical protein